MRGSSLADFTLLLLPSSARRHGCTSSFLPLTGVAAGWQRGGWRAVVFVRVCFSMCSGMGVALFVVTQVCRGFPRCYFLLTFLFVLASHHMLWLVLPFEGVGPQHNSISPHKACQSLFSFQAWGFCPSEWVSMSPCFHFRLFMSMPRRQSTNKEGRRWFKMDTLLYRSYVSAY